MCSIYFFDKDIKTCKGQTHAYMGNLIEIGDGVNDNKSYAHSKDLWIYVKINIEEYFELNYCTINNELLTR